jgi:hypothetical protein
VLPKKKKKTNLSTREAEAGRYQVTGHPLSKSQNKKQQKRMETKPHVLYPKHTCTTLHGCPYWGISEPNGFMSPGDRRLSRDK